MGVMPVRRLLLTMALPMVVSMLVQALYNIVDSMYVARIGGELFSGESSVLGEKALSALSLAFPIQNLMIGVAGGTGVGMNALLSKSLGERNFKEANNAASNGLFLGFLAYVAFAVLGLVGSRFYFAYQTADPVIVEFGTSYLRICTVASFGLFFQMMFERLLQSTGKTFYSMILQGVGALVNIILDPILIFGWFGFPELGVAGAAAATVFSQMIAACLGVYFNFRHNPEVRIQVKTFRPRGATIKRIYAVGIPSILMTSVGSIMVFGMNQILLAFREVATAATAVFGAYFKVQSFIFMPVFGLNNAMVPILAYNYGARDRSRMVQTIRMSILYAVAIMVTGMILFHLIPGQMLSLFNASEEMLQIGKVAFRLISLSFSFAGFCIVVGSVFQALGKGMLSLIASAGRQLLVLLPAAYLLSLTGNLDLVWLSYPIAEVASVALNGFFLWKVYREIIKPLDGPARQPAPAAAEG